MVFLSHLLMFLLLITAFVLIVLVLIQRGKGGGLAGAFGGMGGQSAFGTKAGDLFTKITIGVATFWIALCIVTVKVLGVGGGVLSQDIGGAADTKPGINAPAPGNKHPAATPKGAAEAPPAGVPAKSGKP
jgi:preprotein translocase subunit SecG